jgi:hypothetical protein
MQPTDLQRLAEQLQEEGYDRVVTAPPGHALAIFHQGYLLLAELDTDGTLHIIADEGVDGPTHTHTISDFEEASSWLEEWLDDVN